MADDSPALAALKDQLACAQAARDIAIAKRETADAESAAARAPFGNVSGSGGAGEVTVERGAGNAEASLLAARALQDAAARIADAVRRQFTDTEPSPQVLVFANTAPVVAHWQWFRLELARVSDALDGALEMAVLAGSGEKALRVPRDAPGSNRGYALAGLTGVGAGLEVAAKLAGYLQTSYAVAGNTVSGCDDAALALCVTGLIPGSAYPAIWTPPGHGHEVTRLLEPLADKRVQALAWKEQLLSDPPAANTHEASVAIDAAVGDFDDLVEALAGERNGVPLGALVSGEHYIGSKLQAGALILLVRLNVAVGASYTKKNLWSFLGGLPFYVMGGAVASYLLIDGRTGAVRAAGQYPIHGGYFKVDEVADEFRMSGVGERLPWYFRLAD